MLARFTFHDKMYKALNIKYLRIIQADILLLAKQTVGISYALLLNLDFHNMICCFCNMLIHNNMNKRISWKTMLGIAPANLLSEIAFSKTNSKE